jgi:hypothetical protein
MNDGSDKGAPDRGAIARSGVTAASSPQCVESSQRTSIADWRTDESCDVSECREDFLEGPD